MTDQINDLLARCYAAVEKDGSRFPDYDFHIQQLHTMQPFEWFVGYRNSGDFKNNAYGATLQAALETWLDEYEHHYDDGPYT